MARTPIIIDTDGGVDDAAAIWLALEEPALDVIAITAVAGNVGAAQAARNVLALLHAAGRGDIPVALGSEEPVGPVPEVPGTEMIHGMDGLGNADLAEPPLALAEEDAVELLLRVTAERPGEVTIVAIGPLTNIANAVTTDAAFAGRVAGLTAMGGVVELPGNTTALAEYNIAKDPSAAATVVAAAWSTPPTLVTLDATEVATLGTEDLDLLAERRTDAASFLDGPIQYYRNLAALLSPDGSIAVHDALAVLSVTDPDVIEVAELPLQVDTGGSAAWGMTVADRRVELLASGTLPPELVEMARAEIIGDKPIWNVTTGADRDRFRARMRNLFGT